MINQSKKRNISTIIIILLIVVTLTGCNKDTNKKTTGQIQHNGNCSSIDCIKKIKTNSTLADVNKIIGLDGKVVDEANQQYTWKLSDEESVNITFNSDKDLSGNTVKKATTIISIEYDEKDLENKNLDSSKYKSINSTFKSGKSLTYDQFKEKLGGIEGKLIAKSDTEEQYIGRGANGRDIKAIFSLKEKKWIMINGIN